MFLFIGSKLIKLAPRSGRAREPYVPVKLHKSGCTRTYDLSIRLSVLRHLLLAPVEMIEISNFDFGLNVSVTGVSDLES